MTAIVAGGAAYFGAYLRQKAQNLATHEDIQKLVEQVQATTEATKAIESRIDDEFWNKQRVWEMKRDVLFEVSVATARLDVAILHLLSSESAGQNAGFAHGAYTAARAKASEEWGNASDQFDEKMAPAIIVCGCETYRAINDVQQEAIKAYKMIRSGEATTYAQLPIAYKRAIKRAQDASRAELGTGSFS